MAVALTFLDNRQPLFPAPESALLEPDGLLAAGGNLETGTLLDAYCQGIFPWYEQGQPILWWSPSERAVLGPGQLHISRSLQKLLRDCPFELTTDQAFARVIEACAKPRQYSSGTWITEEMLEAYQRLHVKGHAHSIEVWEGGALVGGLYGLAIGAVFCGESMFSAQDNASKVAFVALARTLFRNNFRLIDCQIPNQHLQSLGVTTISRRDFLDLLHRLKSLSIKWPGHISVH